MSARFLALASLLLILTTAAAADEPPSYVGEWRLPGAPYSVIVDDDFNVFVTQIAPYLISKFTSTGVPLGSFAPLASPSSCTYPFGIAESHDGSIYVAMPPCHRVQKFSHDFQYQYSLTGFFYPFGVAVDGADNVFVADTYNNHIQKFDRDGHFLLLWGSQGSGPGQFDLPISVAVDEEGLVYVLDQGNQRVQIFEADGTWIRAWGEPGFGRDYLNQPMNLAVDSQKNVYVADTYNSLIKKFDAYGHLLAVWGSYGYGPGEFITPHGVAVDDDDVVYVGDPGGRRIEKFIQPLRAWLVLQPRTVNTQSSGRWLTGYITPPAAYQASQIEVPSLRLNEMVPVDPAAPVEIADVDGDGVEELLVKWVRADLISASVVPGPFPVRLTGLVAGRPMAARDTITVVGKTTFERQVWINEGVGGRPTLVALHPVTPNPVRASCEIGLDLPTETSVRLQVFDVNGRLFDTIVDGTMSAGRVRLPWIPKGIPAGLYFVRLQAEGSTQFQRLIVVR